MGRLSKRRDQRLLGTGTGRLLWSHQGRRLDYLLNLASPQPRQHRASSFKAWTRNELVRRYHKC